MRLRERAMSVTVEPGTFPDHIGDTVEERARKHSRRQRACWTMPVRFVVALTRKPVWECEVGVLEHEEGPWRNRRSMNRMLFDFVPRRPGGTRDYTAVLIVPTGIGAVLGGHAGDAGPVARMLAACCDTLITHPNVVNASDVMELPENGLYVEGSILSRLLMGTVGLERVRSNRVLVVCDPHPDQRIMDLTVNAVSAARASMGIDCARVVRMAKPIVMRSFWGRGGARAVGEVDHIERLCSVLETFRGDYDAVALSSRVEVPPEYHLEYYTGAGRMVNPWGGVEAMLTHAISSLYDVPCAHAPMVESMEVLQLEPGVVDPRMAAEAISCSYLLSCLKGLSRAPRVLTDQADLDQPGVITAADVSCMIIPDGCLGLPTLAACRQGIPVIAVAAKTLMECDISELPFRPGQLILAKNYVEAAGCMMALRAGVTLDAVRRPIKATEVIEQLQC